MVVFDNVSKTYKNGFRSVKSLSFRVQRGEFLVLIGPSGCGKTTTLKMINRLIPHTEGTITVDGKDIAKQNVVELRRNIGYVIQQIGLFPHYTIEENIALVPALKGWDRKKIRQRVEELLHLVGLDPAVFARRYPKELSGGQQQRVGVARAMAADPELILMDEPFGALDPITREQLQDEFLRLQKEFRKTIIFVTHDMDEAIRMGDRIAILKDGELLQLDTPERLLTNPVHGFVEQFIGKNRIFQNPELLPVTEVMRSDPATISPHRSPERAISHMRQRHTDTLLCVDEQGRLLGIVSAYDLQGDAARIQSVGEIMQPADPILPLEATARDALVKISESRFGLIPVVDSQGKLTGVVTKGSLLTVLAGRWKEAEAGVGS
ncbi:MAG: proline/glycine betaine ABC transporter ATP-binding protein [Thermobacillus sp. ZCTH02-B1]|uniref:ABC transporter ATP-binding protein n=1 Tax=Thermobacillus sp. ZCTH02-B1 TaxID=1858795 RepID=UPI000B5672A7|nr:ABC transporter ATP-binding protein [Thermobacillus sp. ZCTH02-B1]OUM96901.1 MAG: proline/glycine betaine ABC transporter ATP-binding protein [Thermobacillus sp. ZCTH02-B1]